MAETATVVETAQNPTEAPSTPVVPATPAPAEVKGAEQPAPEKTSLLFDAEATEAHPAEAGKPADKPAGAPEKYEFKAPEGQSYDPQVIEEFSAAAKAANLTQDAAQVVIDKMAPALAARQQAQVEAIHKEWVEAVKTDKEYGGDKLKENMALARKALAQFDPTPLDERGQPLPTPLRSLLKDTGLEYHPELLRVLVRVGRAISADGFVTRSTGPETVQLNDFASLANRLYPPKG